MTEPTRWTVVVSPGLNNSDAREWRELMLRAEVPVWGDIMRPCRQRTVLVLLCVLVSLGLQAQKNDAFEVASVKENRSGQTRYSFSPGLTSNLWGQVIESVGLVTITNAPLREIIARAYGIELGLERYTVFGGPDEILDRRFDIAAQPPASGGNRLQMLRTLLSERFALRIRGERRGTPAYVLTQVQPGRLGQTLQRSKQDCAEFFAAVRESPDAPEPRNAHGDTLCRRGVTYSTGSSPAIVRSASHMDVLVRQIQPFFDLPLVDATGLEGSFEWRLSFGGKDAEGKPLLTVFEALERQLGIKAERRTVQRDVFVIDAVDMPTPN